MPQLQGPRERGVVVHFPAALERHVTTSADQGQRPGHRSVVRRLRQLGLWCLLEVQVASAAVGFLPHCVDRHSSQGAFTVVVAGALLGAEWREAPCASTAKTHFEVLQGTSLETHHSAIN